MRESNRFNIDQAIRDALESIDRLIKMDQVTGEPGDLYIFDTPVELAVEWLIVNTNEDIATIVPVDDANMFLGRCDIELNPPMVARCAWANFVPLATVKTWTATRRITESELKDARRRLGELARGEGGSGWLDDNDPEYIEHIELLKTIQIPQ